MDYIPEPREVNKYTAELNRQKKQLATSKNELITILQNLIRESENCGDDELFMSEALQDARDAVAEYIKQYSAPSAPPREISS